MISSLLIDGDLNLGNNYQSARQGGFDAGRRYAGHNLDHHTLVIDRRSGETTLWSHIYGFEPELCDAKDRSCVGYRRISNSLPDYAPNSPDFIERPWHSVPFPALVALLISPARQESFEPYSIYVVVLISWLAGLLTYACGLRLGLGRKGSLGAVALLYFASPWFVYSHELFAMTFLGLFLVAALWAFLYGRFIIAAVFITTASLQSEAFIAIIPAWILFLYFAKQKRAAWIFGIAAMASVLGASVINRLVLGKVSLRGMWFVFGPVLWKAFVEPQSGLFLFVPWCLAVFLFIAMLFINRKQDRDRQLIIIVAGFLPMAAIYALMPDTGAGYGPRYWIPTMPWLAILFAAAAKKHWNFKPRLVRPLLVALIGVSTLFAITAAAANYSVTEFWVKPPWHASKMFLLGNNYRNQRCPAAKTEVWIGAGCGEAATTRTTVTIPEPVQSSALVVVSRLACATHIPDGTEVLRVRAFDGNGDSETVSIIAGRDSSEWSYDCKTTNMNVRHRKASVLSSYSAGLDNQACEGHRYIATLRFSKLLMVKEMQFESVAGQMAIILDRVSLTNETTGESYLIDPSLFKPWSSTTR
jgi:hypothetical protein